jgi:PKD repeat protein
MQDLPNPPPIDGIAPPEPVRVQEEFVAPKQQPLAPVPGAAKKGINATLVLFAVASVIYLMGAMFLMATLPTPDGTMKQLVSIGTMLYALGALVWLALLVLGLMRISTFKDRPRLRFFGMIRLLGVTVPMLLISIATAVIINIPPRLQLEVIEPTQASQLVAPLSVKFGMDTALRVFDQQGLKPLKYQWDYNNDGVIDQETFDPVSTYLISKAGVYSIVSRVIMTNGQSKNVVYRLVIPRASFGLQPEQPVIDEQASFSLEHLFPKASDTKTPKLKKATWDFDGDGLIDLETDKMTATYTYHKLGTFNVAVSMTLDNQSQSSLQRVITVVEPPSQPFPIELETEPTVLLGPPPMGVLFSLKTDEPVANASWEFGDQKTGEGLRVAHVYSAVGTYSVKATVRSASGSVAILNKIVRVTNPLEIRDLAFEGEPPVKSFSVEGHVPLTVDITPTTFQPLITFSWDAPSATESQITDKHFHAIYRDTGKYYVDLIGVDPDQNVFRRRITVNALPPESVVAFSMDPAAPTAPATV